MSLLIGSGRGQLKEDYESGRDMILILQVESEFFPKSSYAFRLSEQKTDEEEENSKCSKLKNLLWNVREESQKQMGIKIVLCM